MIFLWWTHTKLKWVGLIHLAWMISSRGVIITAFRNITSPQIEGPWLLFGPYLTCLVDVNYLSCSLMFSIRPGYFCASKLGKNTMCNRHYYNKISHVLSDTQHLVAGGGRISLTCTALPWPSFHAWFTSYETLGNGTVYIWWNWLLVTVCQSSTSL